MKKNSSNKIVFYNVLSTIILYAISFFSSPIFSRMLGASHYGVVQVYNTWQSFFTIIVGLMTRGVLQMARVKYTEQEQEAFQSSVLGLSTLSFVSIFTLCMAFHKYIVPFFGLGVKYLAVLLLHSFSVYCVFFINTKFTFEMKAGSNLLISVILALSTFALSFALVSQSQPDYLYAGRIMGMVIPYILVGIWVLRYVFSRGKLVYSREYWRFTLPLCIPLIFHSIASMICDSGDRIMIQKMIGISAVGVYALAYNFANVMSSIWGALNNSWSPFMVDYIKNNQYSLLKEKSRNYVRIFTCLCMGFVLLTPEVFHIYADKEYWEGTKVIPVVILSHFAIFVYAFASNYEFCFMRTDFVAIGSVIAGVANVVLNFLMIPIWGYLGAAIATVLSNVILVLCHVWFARKLSVDKWVYSAEMFIPSIFMLGIVCVIYYLCYDIWFIRWPLAAATGVYMLADIYKRKSIF